MKSGIISGISALLAAVGVFISAGMVFIGSVLGSCYVLVATGILRTGWSIAIVLVAVALDLSNGAHITSALFTGLLYSIGLICLGVGLWLGSIILAFIAEETGN